MTAQTELCSVSERKPSIWTGCKEHGDFPLHCTITVSSRQPQKDPTSSSAVLPRVARQTSVDEGFSCYGIRLWPVMSADLSYHSRAFSMHCATKRVQLQQRCQWCTNNQKWPKHLFLLITLQPPLLSPHSPFSHFSIFTSHTYESVELTCHHRSRLVEGKKTSPMFTAGEAFNVTAGKISLISVAIIKSSLWMAAGLTWCFWTNG